MAKQSSDRILLPKDPAWYKNGVIYEVPVRAFCRQ